MIRTSHKKTHGLARTPEYRVWAEMKRRCTNVKAENYPRYGGAGVNVCRQWVESFETFLADMGNRPAAGYSIDRMDNSKGYEPGNCRWATAKEQAQNKSNNVIINAYGKSMCVSEWARHLGIRPSVIHQRLRLGWSIERVLKRPLPAGKGRLWLYRQY